MLKLKKLTGFSLIEVILGIVVVSIALVSVLRISATSSKIAVDNSLNQKAILLAKYYLAKVQTLQYYDDINNQCPKITIEANAQYLCQYNFLQNYQFDIYNNGLQDFRVDFNAEPIQFNNTSMIKVKVIVKHPQLQQSIEFNILRQVL